MAILLNVKFVSRYLTKQRNYEVVSALWCLQNYGTIRYAELIIADAVIIVQSICYGDQPETQIKATFYLLSNA